MQFHASARFLWSCRVCLLVVVSLLMETTQGLTCKVSHSATTQQGQEQELPLGKEAVYHATLAADSSTTQHR